jgi:hypothetical protein
MYIHATNRVTTFEDLKNIEHQIINFKPKGFWYANENDWIQWVGENMGIIYNYFFEVKVHHTDLKNPDRNKILYLETIEDMIEFSLRFKSIRGIEYYDDKDDYYDDIYNNDNNKIIYDINWEKVAGLYGGIEIKISRTCHLSKEYNLLWASTFDVHSGCVWNMKAIEYMRTIDPIKFVEY